MGGKREGSVDGFGCRRVCRPVAGSGVGFQLMDSAFSAGWELSSFVATEGKRGEVEVSESWGHLKQPCGEDEVAQSVSDAENICAFRLSDSAATVTTDAVATRAHLRLPPSTSSPDTCHLHLLAYLFTCRLCCSWSIPGVQDPSPKFIPISLARLARFCSHRGGSGNAC